ncbi:Cleavage and polyadenylation specificity factor subunit 3-II [Dionaea muscipula]
MAIECLVLGAGQEVGKSCVVVNINGKKVMFDCGMHMGYHDHRRYPDFYRLSSSGDFDAELACVIITHFHLDHIGALPYFTEVCGYAGPIYMTYPTKALAPLMLEDFRKVMVDRRGEAEQFTSEHIMACIKKVTAVDLKQTVKVDEDLEIRAYYAGHVLGAAMFYAKVGDSSIVYTGDYNMTADRHLGAAQIDRLQLDLLISESTYATTVRDSKHAREREFLNAVHKCVTGGGKVLIPTFALGRAQELCILLEDFWERMNLKIPIYFSAGLTIQANMYYKMLINWTSQRVKQTCTTHNAFDFKHVCSFDRSLINAPGPCVLFATPGMISGGFSLEVFKHWAPSEMNLVTLPGYCVAGTVGHKLMSGKPTKIDLDQETQIDVRCQIHQLSFSPHTDGKGIMDLIRFLSPKHVILVHGEKPKMATLKERIQKELGIPCYHPANNEQVCIPSNHYVRADASATFIQSSLQPNFSFKKTTSLEGDGTGMMMLQVHDTRVADGILVMEENLKLKAVHQDELILALGKNKNEVSFAYCCPVQGQAYNNNNNNNNTEKTSDVDLLTSGQNGSVTTDKEDRCLGLLYRELVTQLSSLKIEDFGEYLLVESLRLELCSKDSCPYRFGGGCESHYSKFVFFCCSWSAADDELAWKVISALENIKLVVPETSSYLQRCWMHEPMDADE